jgi:DNA-binding GntR family transcriptional regulator
MKLMLVDQFSNKHYRHGKSLPQALLLFERLHPTLSIKEAFKIDVDNKHYKLEIRRPVCSAKTA